MGEVLNPTTDLNSCPGIIWLAHHDKNIINDEEKWIREKLQNCIN